MATLWILDSVNEDLDFREIGDDEETIIQYRVHHVLTRHRILSVTTDGYLDSDTGDDLAQTGVQAYVGEYYLALGSTFGVSAEQAVCTADVKTREIEGGDVVRQTQTWELYTEWDDAPSGWNWNP